MNRVWPSFIHAEQTFLSGIDIYQQLSHLSCVFIVGCAYIWFLFHGAYGNWWWGIKFAAFGQNSALFHEAASAVVLGAWCGGRDGGRRRVAKTFMLPRAKQKGKKWQLTRASRIKCSNSEKTETLAFCGSKAENKTKTKPTTAFL